MTTATIGLRGPTYKPKLQCGHEELHMLNLLQMLRVSIKLQVQSISDHAIWHKDRNL